VPGVSATYALPDGSAGKHGVVKKFDQLTRRLLSGAAFLLLACLVPAQDNQLALASQQANQLMAEGQFKAAIPIYQKLVAAVPGNPGLLLNLGLAEEMAGHPAQAIPHFQSVLRSDPNNVPALTSLGTCALQTNQPKLAVPPLEALTKLQPSDLNARGMLAGAYMALDRPGEAASHYRTLTAAAPSDAKGWYGLGKAYEASAAQVFNRLSKVAGQSAYIAALLGDARLQRQQYRSAFFFYKEAEAKMPGLPGLHSGLAKIYQESGHADWANVEEKRERPAKTCTSQTPECHFLHGDLLRVTRSATATPDSLFWAVRAYNLLAIRAFDHLSQLPESVELHALRAQMFHGHGQEAEAAAEWKKALVLQPGNPRLEGELATALFGAHNYDELTPLLNTLLAREPAAADLNFMMGESLWRTQQAEKAEPYLRKALLADPGMLPAHAALGMVYGLLNRSAEAVPHLQKALSLDDDGSLHYSLARAYQAAGKAAEAQSAMQEYQQIRQKNQEINDELAKQAEIVAPNAR